MNSGDSVSYWQNTSQTIALSTDLPRTVDVAVIGGVLLGAATCYDIKGGQGQNAQQEQRDIPPGW